VELMLPKEKLSTLIAALQAGYRVLAPMEHQGGLRFAPVDDPDRVRLNYRNTPTSPKAAFFPQVECMMRFSRELASHNVVTSVPVDTTPTVLLGVRPCDARALLLLDSIFGQGPYTDPYYCARRENTVIVGLACTRPRSTCFCHAFGSGPYDVKGSDVLLEDAGDAYIVRSASDRGAALLEGLEGLQPADSEHLARAKEAQAASEAQLTPVEPVTGIESALGDLFEHPTLWRDVSAKCLACGTCTYICPECHCFNIDDRVLFDGGERVRAWDSCMYPEFTVHASGHNPRPDQAARWRQRVMHKFEYLPRNVGMYGCVGCGRCVVSCPVRLDIRQVLDAVRAAAAQPEEVQD